MTEVEKQVLWLRAAELQFRLASAVRLASTLGKQALDLPLEWTHGDHRVRYGEVALTSEQGDYAAWSLHRSATFLIAVALKDAIRVAVPDPKSASDPDVSSAYQIIRLIRNAFAHSPFDPVWSIDPNCRDRVFAVRDIITLNTAELHGAPFDWRHYGGPLALFRLSQYVRIEILKDLEKPRQVIPLPNDEYRQQGDLILHRVTGSEHDK